MEMDRILLAFCNGLSCFIIMVILFQFMNGRYHKTFQKKYVYLVLEAATVIVIAAVNMQGIAVLNLTVWVVTVALLSWLFYYDESDRVLRRITECEAMLLCISVCESLGVLFTDWMFAVMHVGAQAGTMLTCMEITFSKVVVIFMYYMVLSRLFYKRKTPSDSIQWGMNLIILLYSLVNMLVIAWGAREGRSDLLLTVNMGCIVLADLYLLYFIRISEEKIELEKEVELLEKQADVQYAYYRAQEHKYQATVQILHDVDKHVKNIETLYAGGDNAKAAEYAQEINTLLKPLIPVKYTGNPILDILLTDKAAQIRDKQIALDIKAEQVDLNFLQAVDTTTIFGNLLDNAIEAAGQAAGERFIRLSIQPYQEMVLVRMENSSAPVRVKNGFPISQKGEHHGIGLQNVRRCIAKYDGDITFRQSEGVVTVDLLLNS